MSEPCLHIDFTCILHFILVLMSNRVFSFKKIQSDIPDCALIRYYDSWSYMESEITALCIFLNKQQLISFPNCKTEPWPPKRQYVPNLGFGEPLHPYNLKLCVQRATYVIVVCKFYFQN